MLVPTISGNCCMSDLLPRPTTVISGRYLWSFPVVSSLRFCEDTWRPDNRKIKIISALFINFIFEMQISSGDWRICYEKGKSVDEMRKTAVSS
jgi:hypothetical protein